MSLWYRITSYNVCYTKLLREEVAAYQAAGKPPVESMFDYMFAELPAELEAQRERALRETR